MTVQSTEDIARRCAQRGMRLTEAAAECGLRPEQLKRMAARKGIQFSPGPGRSEDDEVLQMLDLRLRRTSTEIAQALGVTPERVRVATQRVMDADLAESGEGPEALRRYYPWSRGLR